MKYTVYCCVITCTWQYFSRLENSGNMDKKSSKKRSLLEQDFPRGGGSIDPQEYREIAREADQDLFATTVC